MSGKRLAGNEIAGQRSVSRRLSPPESRGGLIGLGFGRGTFSSGQIGEFGVPQRFVSLDANHPWIFRSTTPAPAPLPFANRNSYVDQLVVNPLVATGAVPLSDVSEARAHLCSMSRGCRILPLAASVEQRRQRHVERGSDLLGVSLCFRSSCLNRGRLAGSCS